MDTWTSEALATPEGRKEWERGSGGRTAQTEGWGDADRKRAIYAGNSLRACSLYTSVDSGRTAGIAAALQMHYIW